MKSHVLPGNCDPENYCQVNYIVNMEYELEIVCVPSVSFRLTLTNCQRSF